MDRSVASPTPRSVVVGVFEGEGQARQALSALRGLGWSDQQLGVLGAGQRLSPASETNGLLTMASASAAAEVGSSELSAVLVSMGLNEGEARFYAEQSGEGRALVVVDGGGRADEARAVMLQHGGYDVESLGQELARGQGVGVAGGTGAQPIDVTDAWLDVRSRYEMLWAQHFGTTDATWERMEPVYAWAWRAANAPRQRGRPWSEVEASVRASWDAAPEAGLAWSAVADAVHDVWDDVAEEAATGAEGGADRRIPTSGSDQSMPARDVVVPGPQLGA